MHISTFSVKTTFPVDLFIQFVHQPIARLQIGSQNFDTTPTSTSEDRFHLRSWKVHLRSFRSHPHHSNLSLTSCFSCTFCLTFFNNDSHPGLSVRLWRLQIWQSLKTFSQQVRRLHKKKINVLVNFDLNVREWDREEDFVATEERRVKKYFFLHETNHRWKCFATF